MKTILSSWLMIFSALFAVAPPSGFSAALASATQFCRLNPSKTTDLCFALTSSQNSSTETKDLSLHISARFPAQGTGWAAVGIGHQMAGSLMFVMYPSSSVAEDEDVTFSIRTTSGYTGPVTLSPSTLAGHKGPDIHVTRKWVDNDLYNVQLTCYGCEKWSGSTLDVTSTKQTWIWAWNGKEETGIANEKIKLKKHEDRGVAYLDMSTSYSASGDLALAQVSDRVSTPSTSAPPKKHHAHSAFGLVSIHGFVLSSSFLVLSFGLLAIRFGLAKSFKYHWVIQLVASGFILIGCGMGVLLSFKHGGKFNTTHQWLGMFLGLGIVVQSWLGWRHHVIFVKIGRRTAFSNYHVWFGRMMVVMGNVNVAFGLKLGNASQTKYMFWLTGVGVQLVVLIPMWYFWSRGKKILDVVGSKELKDSEERGGYEDAGVEEEAFLVGEDEEIELEEEQPLHNKEEDLDIE